MRIFQVASKNKEPSAVIQEQFCHMSITFQPLESGTTQQGAEICVGRFGSETPAYCRLIYVPDYMMYSTMVGIVTDYVTQLTVLDLHPLQAENSFSWLVEAGGDSAWVSTKGGLAYSSLDIRISDIRPQLLYNRQFHTISTIYLDQGSNMIVIKSHSELVWITKDTNATVRVLQALMNLLPEKTYNNSYYYATLDFDKLGGDLELLEPPSNGVV